MECPSCSSIWNYDDHMPRTSICGNGHIICHSCCLQRLDDNIFTCICSNAYRIETVRNFEESELQYKTRCIKVLTPNDQFLLMMFDSTTTPRSNSVKEVMPGYMCEMHGQPVHSYAEKPFTYVCNRCKYEEYKDINLTYRELPQVVTHLKNQLADGLNALKNKKRINVGMINETKPPEHWRSMMAKMDKHYATFYNLFINLHQNGIIELEIRKSKLETLGEIYRKEILKELNITRIRRAEAGEMQDLPDGMIVMQL